MSSKLVSEVSQTTKQIISDLRQRDRIFIKMKQKSPIVSYSLPIETLRWFRCSQFVLYSQVLAVLFSQSFRILFSPLCIHILFRDTLNLICYWIQTLRALQDSLPAHAWISIRLVHILPFFDWLGNADKQFEFGTP